jgi:hypothetical protein
MTLKAPGRALRARVLEDYELTGAELAVLEQACMAADRIDEAQRQIATDGAVIAGRAGPRAHPSVLIERDSRAAMLRALKDLGVIDRKEPRPRTLSTPGPKPRSRA